MESLHSECGEGNASLGACRLARWIRSDTACRHMPVRIGSWLATTGEAIGFGAPRLPSRSTQGMGADSGVRHHRRRSGHRPHGHHEEDRYQATAEIFVAATQAADTQQQQSGNKYLQNVVQSYVSARSTRPGWSPARSFRALHLPLTDPQLAGEDHATAPLNKVLIDITVIQPRPRAGGEDRQRGGERSSRPTSPARSSRWTRPPR